MSAGSAAGGTLGAIGSIVQGQSTAKTLDYNANLQMQNAKNALISAKLNADKSDIMSQKVMGQARANYGASGVSSDSGSVLAVMSASAANAETDKNNIIYGGQIKSVNFENQASLDKICIDILAIFN